MLLYDFWKYLFRQAESIKNQLIYDQKISNDRNCKLEGILQNSII